MNATIVFFNYRGYGMSQKAIIHEDGIKKDAQTILNFVYNNYGTEKKIFLMGKSLGCAVATVWQTRAIPDCHETLHVCSPCVASD